MRGAELVGLGMGQFQRRHLLQMVVQQPGMVDQGLQNQRLAAGNRAALAAHDRAQGELGAGRLVGPAGDPGLVPEPGPRPPRGAIRPAAPGVKLLRGRKTAG